MDHISSPMESNQLATKQVLDNIFIFLLACQTRVYPMTYTNPTLPLITYFSFKESWCQKFILTRYQFKMALMFITGGIKQIHSLLQFSNLFSFLIIRQLQRTIRTRTSTALLRVHFIQMCMHSSPSKYSTSNTMKLPSKLQHWHSF